MEHLHSGGLHGPLERRLTKMYSDTKKSYDMVIEPKKTESCPPELSALHRKLRIQKDRLITWGLDWSDTSAAGDIDESLERAGLGDVVGSIMITIKDLLGEAERLGGPESENLAFLSGKSKEKVPFGRWNATDKLRFEDLLRDLTTSIDSLHNISRTRRAFRQNTPSKDSKSPQYFSESNRTRSQGSLQASVDSSILYPPANLPSVFGPSKSSLALDASLPLSTGVARPIDLKSLLLDPAYLILPEHAAPASSRPPPYEAIATPSNSRTMGYIRRPHSSNNPWKMDGNRIPTMPVLIEYAPFDPIYTSTGITPSLARLEQLAEILHNPGENNESRMSGTLELLGYFEDSANSRFGLVFELPDSVYGGPTDSQKMLNSMKPLSLLSLLRAGEPRNSFVPNLEDRFYLAYNIANSFFELHAKGMAHRDVNSNNIVFFPEPNPPRGQGVGCNIRAPYLSSFDLFSEFDFTSPTPRATCIYRHPADSLSNKVPEEPADRKFAYDIYSLGLVLFEIGLWMPLDSFYKLKYTPALFRSRIEGIYVKKLGSKCGSAYMRAVETCLSAAEIDLSGPQRDLNLRLVLYRDVVKRLDRCCAIDDAQPSFQSASTTSLALPSTPHRQTSSPSEVESKIAISNQTAALQNTTLSLAASTTSIAVQTESHQIQRTPNPLTQENPMSETITETESFKCKTCLSVLGSSDKLNAHFESCTARHTAQTLPASDLSSYQNAILEILAEGPLSFDVITARLTHSLTGGQPLPAEWLLSQLEHLVGQKKIQMVNETYIISQTTTVMPKGHGPVDDNADSTPKPKLRAYPLKISPEQLVQWHQSILPSLERILERALRDSTETVSIDLIGMGETAITARPTIFIACTSVGKVKGVLKKRFKDSENIFDLVVRRGKVRRSSGRVPRRRNKSLPSRSVAHGYDDAPLPKNPHHQQRPICGASIGAWKDDQHLPPVSYGGVIKVDGETYGMTVHHLLDSSSEDENEYEEEGPLMRSSGRPYANFPRPSHALETSLSSQYPMEETYDYADSDEATDFGEDGEFDWDEEDMLRPIDRSGEINYGDIDGVSREDGGRYPITQPAIDDVKEEFFSTVEARDEEHLDSFKLGYVYASSGVRRWDRAGVTHEIDWALLKIDPDRLQPFNLVQGGRKYCRNVPTTRPPLVEPIDRRSDSPPEYDFYPTGIANADDLGHREVHCLGRTSGLRGGIISPAMGAVKIHGRKSYSRSWHVDGDFGEGGDSGAWVIDNDTGRVCGHVLAWCSTKLITYICPIQVLLEDIANSLSAKSISLPGGEQLSVVNTSHLLTEAGESGMSENLLQGMQQLNLGGFDIGALRSRFSAEENQMAPAPTMKDASPMFRNGGQPMAENLGQLAQG
ncbi:MAG: hypothetical protein M1829_005702 [Trizodia sp. TS-e1964]|nr:MAG: hypothetical protein M1829_005702 [Trizodia sp. TS-e1964]